MQDRSFVFVDIETNGGSGERGRIIEIGALKIVDGQVVDTFQSLVNPGQSLPFWIINLTGITDADVVHAPYFEDIAAQFFEFLGDSIFVAHNVLFDYSFIRRHFQACDYSYRPKLFCTVKLSRALFPEHRGHSLEKIIARHGLQTQARHRAYDDAKAAYDFFTEAMRLKGVEAVESNIIAQLKTKSLPPNVDEQVILDLPQAPGVYIFEDDAGLPLYVGKSVNIRARVRSHFTSATTIAKELRMSLQSHNVRHVQTETEIEALLLESTMVKQLQPVFNRRLRRKKTQSIIVKHVDDKGFLTFTIERHDLSQYARLDSVYGVFTSPRQAKTKLEEVAKTYQLCPKLLGLETRSGACFRYQLGLCRGACIEKESAESYNARVEYALERMKIETWPYDSPVAVSISSTRSLIVDQWVPVGLYDSELDAMTDIEGGFDIDTYKIIRSFIRAERPMIIRYEAR